MYEQIQHKTKAANKPVTHKNHSTQHSAATAQLRDYASTNANFKQPAIQKKQRNNGLPSPLQAGIEQLSGISMEGVTVHKNSGKPAQLNAHAYAQGNEIHLAAGQEHHLPHEAWHVVQQKQGRVRPTLQMNGGVNINDDSGLEREADVMGAKALQMKIHSNEL